MFYFYYVDLVRFVGDGEPEGNALVEGGFVGVEFGGVVIEDRVLFCAEEPEGAGGLLKKEGEVFTGEEEGGV